MTTPKTESGAAVDVATIRSVQLVDLAPRTILGVLVMSNGGFGGVHQKLLEALAR